MTFDLLTKDGWRLSLQAFLPEKPTFSQPLLCIHGFAQSHWTWTGGRFAQRLMERGIPTYVLDLRGHGDSAVEYQKVPYPHDIAYEWDTSAFVTYDIPATIAFIQERHPGQKIALCGHSMGGILSIVTALQRQADIAALIPIAAPIDGRKMGLQLRWVGRALSGIHRRLPGTQRWWRAAPMHHLFKLLDAAYHRTNPGLSSVLPALIRYDKKQVWPQLWHPDFTSQDVVQKTFQQSHPEAMGVVRDILRWARHGNIDIGSSQRINYTPHFHDITIPVLAAWGERDILAPPKSGNAFLRNIQSKIKHKLTLPNARHLDVVAGQPSEQIIEGIEELYGGLNS